MKAPAGHIAPLCGGQPLVAVGEDSPAGLAAVGSFQGGSLVGKRYSDESGAIEFLCIQAGTSSLSIGDALALTDAKPLPSSD